MSRIGSSIGPWGAFLLLAVMAGVGFCTRDMLRHDDEAVARGEPLGLFSPGAPGLSPDHALETLARDARRREIRFRDAVAPGTSLDATRIDARAIASTPPAQIYELGAQLFHHRFTPGEGFGDGGGRLRRVHLGQRGGPDAYSCSECHRRGGVAGAGDASDNAYLDGDGDRPASAFERNPPALIGAGLVELIAKEMSADLAAQRDDAIASAKRSGEPSAIMLKTKGVAFGRLVAKADGTVDAQGVRGVSADLIVRPFGYKGHAASLVEIVDDELHLHHGMQSARLLRQGDPLRMGNGALPDPDGDGVKSEISDGQLAVLTLFIAMQEVPQMDMPQRSDLTALWPQGEARFRELGCASCHVPSLPLDDTRYTLDLPTGRVQIDLAKDGAEPRIGKGPIRVRLFSDLKRHVMGPNLREARSYRTISSAQFVTRPLWGIARSRPYMHDARAPTLDAAILAHSGEATDARNAYDALSDEERGPVRIYLMSLSRARRLTTP